MTSERIIKTPLQKVFDNKITNESFMNLECKSIYDVFDQQNTDKTIPLIIELSI